MEHVAAMVACLLSIHNLWVSSAGRVLNFRNGRRTVWAEAGLASSQHIAWRHTWWPACCPYLFCKRAQPPPLMQLAAFVRYLWDVRSPAATAAGSTQMDAGYSSVGGITGGNSLLPMTTAMSCLLLFCLQSM